MERNVLIIIAVTTVAVAFMLAQWQQQQAEENAGYAADGGPLDMLTDAMQSAGAVVAQALGLWRPPAAFAQAIAEAEARYGLPRDLLARLLWQESRYRPEIINGTKRSPAGAVGIAQFMPATAQEWGVNPLDPFSSIDGAARYLAWLYRKFGNWTEALAAYNWGIGNVQRRGLDAAPQETRDYYGQILADVNAATGTTIV